MTEAHDNSLVILDDLMSQCSNDQRVADLFTCGSHHRGISVLFLTQNLFPPGKLSRTISLNSHYMLIFRNPRDSLGIATLARQMYPKNVGYLLESFNDATKRPYGYLLLDLHQLTPEDLRLRTNILPNERQIVYVKRNWLWDTEFNVNFLPQHNFIFPTKCKSSKKYINLNINLYYAFCFLVFFYNYTLVTL